MMLVHYQHYLCVQVVLTVDRVFLTFALWFWNQTWTTRTLSPVSAASVSLTCKSQHSHTHQPVLHTNICLMDVLHMSGTLC